MPEPVEVTRLMQALDAFDESKPRDLPDGVSEAIEGVRKAFANPADDPDLTPGMRAAAQSSYGTGVPLKHAARHEDRPTPGQKAARGISDEIQKKAQAIVEQHSQ